MSDLPPQRVTLVTLGVRDLARSRAFYRALGWQPAQEMEEVSFFQMQASALALFGLVALLERLVVPWARAGASA